MKNKWKITFLLTLVLILGCAVPVSAKKAAAKVTAKTTYTSSIQHTTLYGKTSSGKTVWTYKGKKYPATELCALSYVVRGNNVYIIEGSKFVRLNKKTGKIIVRKNYASSGIVGGSATLKADSKGNLYAQGYYEDTIFKFNKKGRILWKQTVRDCYWPYEMSISGGRLKIKYSGAGGYTAVSVNTSNGKKVKYYH